MMIIGSLNMEQASEKQRTSMIFLWVNC